jgi:hypothetical protein
VHERVRAQTSRTCERLCHARLAIKAKRRQSAGRKPAQEVEQPQMSCEVSMMTAMRRTVYECPSSLFRLAPSSLCNNAQRRNSFTSIPNGCARRPCRRVRGQAPHARWLATGALKAIGTHTSTDAILRRLSPAPRKISLSIRASRSLSSVCRLVGFALPATTSDANELCLPASISDQCQDCFCSKNAGNTAC